MKKNPTQITFVTGAARGIGHAIASEFLAAGYRVVGVDLRTFSAPTDERDYDPANFWAHKLDVTDQAAITKLHDEIVAKWGHVSVLVNNAAISPKQPDGYSAKLLNITNQEWASVLAVNLTAVLHMSQAFLPGMQKQQWGRVINLSSLAGRTRSISAGASYMTSKAGVLGLTRAIAAEMGPYGITANSIAPGRIVTEMSMTAGEEANRKIAEQLPVRRLGTVKEIAETVLYLASDGAGYLNGAVIDVNGGHFMP
jgi:3-oxoacyl-[acyl-carrier protein] reductase